MWTKWAGAALLGFVADWLGVAGTRFIVEGSEWVLLVIAANTILWYACANRASRSLYILPLVAGGVAGAWLGLVWP